MKTLLTMLFICLMPLAATARIGETLEQCMARYGKPVSENKERNEVTFVKDEIEVTCRFDAGKCWGVEYRSKDKERGFTPIPLSEDLKFALLDIYGIRYTKVTVPVWTRGDLIAMYDDEYRVLTVSVNEQLKKYHKEAEAKEQAEAKAKEAAAKAKLKGF